MDKRESIKPNTEQKVDCRNIRSTFNTNYTIDLINNILIITNIESNKKVKYENPTSEVHGDRVLDKLLLDIRTTISTMNNCQEHYKYSHRRISAHNYKKLLATNTDCNIITINTIAEDILKPNNTKEIIKQPQYVKQIHFVKAQTTGKNTIIKKVIPIEAVFDEIDSIADDNKNKILSKKPTNAPGNKIMQNNKIRMTYGDINYLGNNKAFFYFDRGYKDIQTFTNSVHPLERQPKHKDLVVIDDIVFTANCICNTPTQHKEIFPHYRVTCAVGLICLARLTAHEKIIYARDRNATTQTPTSARSMLIRYWR